MVLAERNSDPVRNGRRSRGPSPNSHGGASAAGGAGAGNNTGGGGGTNSSAHNAHSTGPTTVGGPCVGTPESSDDDNSIKRNGKSKSKQSEYEEKIRVGRDYQAVCPPLIADLERKPELLNERALLVWSPTKEIPDTKLEEYIAVAKEKYGYNGEQALGMLFWHKHDLERAVMDLANFTPFPDEWTVEDKVLFDQAFQFHGKSFHRIRQMLPDKSIASLVKYYYSWKKTRHRTSALDRQEKAVKAALKEGSENGSELGSNEESDADDKLTLTIENAAGGGGLGVEFSKADVAAAIDAMDADVTFVSASNISGGGMSATASSSNSSSAIGVDGGIIIGSGGGGIGGCGGGGLAAAATTATPAAAAAAVAASCGGSAGGIADASSTVTATAFIGFDDDANPHDGIRVSTNGVGGTVGNSANGCAGAKTTSSSLPSTATGGYCKNCGVVCYHLYDSPHGRLCSSCHSHWRRTGNKRPTSGPCVGKRSRFGADRSKRKPPKGIYINHDDLLSLAVAKTPEDYLGEGERKIASLLNEIQANKQKIEMLDKECNELKVSVDDIPPLEPQRITGRWTNDEMQFAALAMRDYGKDFQAIAKLMCTKTEAHVRSFYMNNRRRMNLDQILKEHEAKQAAADAANNAEIIIATTDATKSGGGGVVTSENTASTFGTISGGGTNVNDQLARNATDNVKATTTATGSVAAAAASVTASSSAGTNNTANSSSSLISTSTAPVVEQKRHTEIGRQKEQTSSVLETATTSTAAAAAAATGIGHSHSSSSNSNSNHTTLAGKLDKDKIIIVADESDTNTTSTSSCSDLTIIAAKPAHNEESLKSTSGASSNSNAKRDNSALQSKEEQQQSQPPTKRVALSAGVHSTDSQPVNTDK